MSPNEANVNKSDCKFDDSDNSVVIPFNIEYITLIAHSVYGVKCLFYISITSPMTILYDVYPNLQ